MFILLITPLNIARYLKQSHTNKTQKNVAAVKQELDGYVKVPGLSAGLYLSLF